MSKVYTGILKKILDKHVKHSVSDRAKGDVKRKKMGRGARFAQIKKFGI